MCIRDSSFSYADRHHGRISLQLAHCHDLRSGGLAARFHDVCSPAWLLPAAPRQETREAHRSTEDNWLHRLVRTHRQVRDGTSLEGVRGLTGISGFGRLFHVATEDVVYARRRSVLV